MIKGRVTKVEQTRRIKLLLEFIFIFCYATRYQLFEFSRNIIGLTSPRWLVDYACKIGLIRSYLAPIFKVKIYYLARKGKDLIRGEEGQTKRYRFEKQLTGINAFRKHNVLVDIYLNFNRHMGAQLINWENDWILRIGRKRREKIPDSMFTLPCGVKVAVELELQHKKSEFLKRMVAIYRYYIEKASRYHAVLIIASDRYYHESLKKRFTKISPFFCQKALIFAYTEMLEQGLCLYNNEVMGLKELGDLLKLQHTDAVVKMSEITKTI